MKEKHPQERREAMVRHQRQVAWQILIPILLLTLIFIFIGMIAILTAGKNPTVNENWAQIATIFLIIPVLLQGIILLVLIILGCWLIGKFTRFIPPYLVNANDLVNRVAAAIMKYVDKTAVPFIKMRSIFAGMTKLFNLIFHASVPPKE